MKFNLKEKFVKSKETIIKIFEKYPLTLILTYILSFLYILQREYVIEGKWSEKIILFFIVGIPGAFFAENILKKGLKRNVVYITTAIISAIFVHVRFLNLENDLIIRWIVCYITTLIAGSIFTIIKKSEKDFSEYVLKVSINVLKASFVYGIVALGSAMILWVFSILIWDEVSDYIYDMEILILGFFYSTKIIYSLINLDEDINNFFKNLIKYVLMPLLLITFTIIYLYIIKILVLRNIPKNQIFRIATALFIIGGFIWTIMGFFKEEGAIYKISTKLPIVFSPFIILQIYAMGVRIANNGITPPRYAGIVFVIFEICYIVCFILKKEKIQNIILVADIFLVISAIVPIINAFDMSDFSQINILKMYNNAQDLTDEEKNKISGAYDYLYYSSKKGKEYIKNNLSEEQIDSIVEFKESRYDIYKDPYEYINFLSNESINIKGYSILTRVSENKYIWNEEKESFLEVDFYKSTSNSYVYDNQNVVITVDLSDMINKIIKLYKKDNLSKSDEYFNKHNEIQINENQKLIIEELSIRYDEKEKKIENYNIVGYLLER